MIKNEIETWNANRSGQPEVASGDVLVVHSRHNEVTNITVREGESFQNRYGRFEHKDLIGKKPGKRWVTSSSKVVTTGAGFVIALRPTPELWSQALSHRTQIVYTHDIAVILMEMELRPGGVVVEAGTGSGSMTASLARSVAPDGRVLTFENHQKRAQTAADEFVKLGLSTVVSVVHRDVVSDGFRGVPDSSVDAVFLDLPSVWDLIPEAARVLRADGVLALFSPCIEQVQKSYEVTRNYQFGELKTITTRCRSWETRPRAGDYHLAESEGDRKRKREREGRGNERGQRLGVPDKGTSIEKPKTEIISKPFQETFSHTSYLTFARRLNPPPADDNEAEGEENPEDAEDLLDQRSESVNDAAADV